MPGLRTPKNIQISDRTRHAVKYVFIRMLQKNIKSRNFRAHPKNQSDFARIFRDFFKQLLV